MKKYYFIMEEDNDDDDDDIIYGISTDTGIMFTDEKEAKKYVNFLNEHNINSDVKYSYVEGEYEEFTTAEMALETFLENEVDHFTTEIEKCSHLSLFKDLAQDAQKYNKNDVVLSLKDIKLLLNLFRLHYEKYQSELDESEVSQLILDIKLFDIKMTTEKGEKVEIRLNFDMANNIFLNAKYVHDWVRSLKKQLTNTKYKLENLKTIGIDEHKTKQEEDEADLDNPDDSIE